MPEFNRRAFLSLFSAGMLGGVAHRFDLDRMLWVPGKRTVFLPTISESSYFDHMVQALRYEASIMNDLLPLIYA